jgi:hypothetical protein
MRHTIKTVGDLIDVLWDYPTDYPIRIGELDLEGEELYVEHRELDGKPILNLWGGGQAYSPIGETPLTDEVYYAQSQDFLIRFSDKHYRYNSDYGTHSLEYKYYRDNPFLYTYDPRIIERMVAEGLIPKHSVDIDRVRRIHDNG